MTIMKKLFIPFFSAILLLSFFSCEKEYSLENGSNTNSNIIGANCRIAKIIFADSASGVGTGSLTATINTSDKAVDVTKFDSLTATIDYNATPFYQADTVFINADEYYVVDIASARVKKFRGLVDPTNPFSLKFDITFTYDAAGYLINKSYELALFPGFPVQNVNYTYNALGNLTHMEETDLTAGGDFVSTADVTYYDFVPVNSISGKNFIYIFPDEEDYAEFTQFLNFGKRTTHVIKGLKVYYYDPGNMVRDSAVSTFKNYTKSADGYITSVIMTGDDQPCIPAEAGRLKFGYKCK